MKAICVFCGSASGSSPSYAAAARALAGALVSKGIALVYGGAKIGLMGVLADEVMERGGEVHGVIPRALLDKEVGHLGITRLHVAADMHDRKATMASLADGFIAMPGGIGTLEELFETWTWLQLGLHDKPVGLFNVAGYFEHLIRFIETANAQGFLSARDCGLLLRADDPALLVERMADIICAPSKRSA